MELKTCPFCGKQPVIRTAMFGMERLPRYGVVCQNCSVCIGFEDTEEKAAERWNRRADNASIDAVPVVRCRDCDWWDTECPNDTKRGYCPNCGCTQPPDFFCADGKRRDGGDA